uniref:Transmembrane protein n=1 Tax=Steinernema glaseri TaxID=37863 RepID=A0A1I7ZT68_9BILA
MGGDLWGGFGKVPTSFYGVLQKPWNSVSFTVFVICDVHDDMRVWVLIFAALRSYWLLLSKSSMSSKFASKS